MTGRGGFRLPWRRGRPAAAIEHVPPPVRRQVTSVEVGPEAVRRAREAVSGHLAAVGVVPGSAFADTVLLVTSELVTNVLRHAARSPVTEVATTVAGRQLVISVTDAEPRLPDLTGEGTGGACAW
ncbi:ATP-binding protein [Streptomyces sp. NPDC007264]|uniref:ATP-binding protein n=1 Tax=Streptomyces sp. NPDC007264 TaxID=3364777 RepID=UPI0036DF0C67